MSTGQSTVERQKYPSDLTDRQWRKIEPFLPSAKSNKQTGGRPPCDLREVINTLFYWVKEGCSWRGLPHDFPKWQSVYDYFRRWSKSGFWEKINAEVAQCVRKKSKLGKKQRRKKRCSAAIVDSQSVKTTGIGGSEIGYDAGKKIKGRKRFILTDTQGLLLTVLVCAASVSEKAGVQRLIQRIRERKVLRRLCAKIKLVWADGGYQGEDLRNWVKDMMGWIWEVVLRSENAVGFELLPRRWVVERTFSWLYQARRLSKDYEKLPQNSESVVYLAMIRIMIRRL